ncbi:unnamed protein product [Amoebophrya sp. A120]|nr:unnamed protein product [Amoebophrya sp. A120]|eukprot:GSA120T00004915001.1
MTAVMPANTQSPLRVLHVAGSGCDDFYFKVSLLYSKAAWVFPKEQVTAYYAIGCPDGSWFLFENDVSNIEVEDFACYLKEHNQTQHDKRLSKTDTRAKSRSSSVISTTGSEACSTTCTSSPSVVSSDLTPHQQEQAKNVLIQKKANTKDLLKTKKNLILAVGSLGELLAFLSTAKQTQNLDVVVPHMFDFPGMTSYRALFEDMLGISVCGPDNVHNVVAQDKALTRSVLQEVPGVKIPKGQTLRIVENTNVEMKNLSPVEQAVKQQLHMQPPFVVKPAREDNSRGVGLVKKNDSYEAMLAKIEIAFSYGDTVVVEEFIPGREMRVGVIQEMAKNDLNEDEIVTKPIPGMVEYFMMNPDMPIRTETDKLTSTDSNNNDNEEKEKKPSTNNFVQTKCARTFTPEVSPELRANLERQTALAFQALAGRDYGLFDYRVHEETGEAYIIECCSFWSFSPISAISLLLENSYGPNSFQQAVMNVWQLCAIRTQEMRKNDLEVEEVFEAQKERSKNSSSEIDEEMEVEQMLLSPDNSGSGSTELSSNCLRARFTPLVADDENDCVFKTSTSGNLHDHSPVIRFNINKKLELPELPCDITSRENTRTGDVQQLANTIAAVNFGANFLRSVCTEEVVLDRLRCFVHIMLLLFLLPVSFLYAVYNYCLVSFDENSAQHLSFRKMKKLMARSVRNKQDGEKITILVTGGKMSKALHLARCLKRADPKKISIVLVETKKYWVSGARFSNVVDHFESVADPVREDAEQYQRDLLALCVKYNVRFFVPVSSPVSSVHDARFGETFRQSTHQYSCNAHLWNNSDKNHACLDHNSWSQLLLHQNQAVCLRPELCEQLDNKHTFAEFCNKNKLPGILQSFMVKSDDEVLRLNDKLLLEKEQNTSSNKTYVLKNLTYDPIHRLDLFQLPCSDQEMLEDYLEKVRDDGNAISATEPWQVQEFVADGAEYSAALLVRGGECKMLTVCESSASQLNYAHVHVPEIEDWVYEFSAKLGADCCALICMDFILAKASTTSGKSRTVHPLECNPRLHSQCSVFSTYKMQKQLGQAVLGIVPKQANSSPKNSPVCGGKPKQVLQPDEHCRQLFFLANEVLKVIPVCVQTSMGLRYGNSTSLTDFVHRMCTEQDADWDPADPLPMLFRNHFQLPLLLFSTLLSTRAWKKCDFCIGKVVETGGD